MVDDDHDLRRMLDRVLRAEGFDVDHADDARRAFELMGAAAPDIVLLDVMLESEDGRDVLAELRRTSDVPVIMLTGLGHENDRILGLKMGADDYVVKPFSPGELVARIETVLRRAPDRRPGSGKRLEFPGLAIDLVAREVTIDGVRVDMTAKEFDLLAFLASSPRQVFTRAQLLEQVWASSPDWQDDATVTEHVRRVRRRIEADALKPRWVKTVRGVGYRFEP